MEIESTSALTNIAQENDGNILKLLQNLGKNNLQFIILKCSRFCLIVFFCFYITFTVYTSVLNVVVWMAKKRKGKSNLKANPPPRLLKLSVFPIPIIPILLTITLWYFSQPPLLTTLFYKTPMDVSGWMKKRWYREISNCNKVILVPNNRA